MGLPACLINHIIFISETSVFSISLDRERPLQYYWKMATTQDDNYSFELVGTEAPNSEPPTTPDSYYDEAEHPSDTAIMVGCGLLGCIAAGPLLAIIAALGGKYAADKNQGPIGDASRALGRVASAAGKTAEEERLLHKMKASVCSLFLKHKGPVPEEFKASEGHTS